MLCGSILKYDYDVITALIDWDLLELSDVTILSPQELVNLKTLYGHYSCVQNDQLPTDWSQYYQWMQRFQNEATLELQKYNELNIAKYPNCLRKI